MTAKEKRIKERLQQIKDRAAEAIVHSKKDDPGMSLAEEAAGLGLELLEEKS